jgi:hypothetical protein
MSYRSTTTSSARARASSRVRLRRASTCVFLFTGVRRRDRTTPSIRCGVQPIVRCRFGRTGDGPQARSAARWCSPGGSGELRGGTPPARRFFMYRGQPRMPPSQAASSVLY